MTERLPLDMRLPARRGRPAALRAAIAIVLHVLLLAALWIGSGHVNLVRPAREVWTSLVAIGDRAVAPRPIAPAAQAATPTPQPPRPAPARVPRPASPIPPATHAPVGESTAITLPSPPAAPTAIAAAPPASAASMPIGSILDTAATRAAIRAAARGPLLSERVAAATGLAPVAGAEERLARGVDAAKHGDCLHGDYPMGGGGLLSLPFLVAAAATGQCAK